MLLLKSMDRLRSRVSIFLAIHFILPVLFILSTLQFSHAESSRDEKFPELTGEEDADYPNPDIIKETQAKLAKVYGPPSPAGSEEEIVISPAKKIGKITPPSLRTEVNVQTKPIEVPALKTSEKEQKAALKKQKREAERLAEEQVAEVRAEQERERLEQERLESERAKKQGEELERKRLEAEKQKAAADEAEKTRALEAKLALEKEKLAKKSAPRIDSKSDTQQLITQQRKEKKYYGMTLEQLSNQWGTLRQRIQGPNTPIEYKKLSKEEKKTVSAKVSYERDKAKERMPILDRGYINEVINKDVVIAQENFAQAPEARALNDVVSRALDVSLQVKLAKEKNGAAKYRAIKTFRDLWSEIRFELIHKNGELTGSPQTGADFKSDMQRVNFKQPMFHGGTLWNTFREEAANAKASREELDKASSKLVLDVSEAYMNYARAQSLFEAKSALAQKMELYKNQNEEKKKVGAISEIEYLNTDSLIGEIRAELQTAHQELALAQLDLTKFLNLPKDAQLRVLSIDALKTNIAATQPAQPDVTMAPQLESPEEMNLELNGLIDRAYLNRADLKVEEYKLMANRYKTKAAYGKFLPQADFIIEVGQLAEAFKLVDKTPPYKDEWKIGVEVSQNFLGSTAKYSYDTVRTAPSVTEFQGGSGTRILSNKFSFALLDGLQQFVDVREAKSQMLEQMVELQEKENEVVKEVKETYYGYHKTLIQLDSAIKKLAHKERVAKLKGYQLEKNQIQLSEYLQAEKDWLDAKNQYAESVAEYYKMRISLNRAIGEKDLLRMDALPLSRKERK